MTILNGSVCSEMRCGASIITKYGQCCGIGGCVFTFMMLLRVFFVTLWHTNDVRNDHRMQ